MLPIDFIVTTIRRDKCVRRLIESIYDFYPEAKITVGDQNEYFRDYDAYQVLNLDYDCGIAKARNEMVKATEEPYVLIMDDDFIFNEQTKLEKMLKIMDDQIGVVGGAVDEKNTVTGFTHNWKIEGDTIKQIDDGDNWEQIEGIKCKETGSVVNFALIKRELLQDVKWDERFKIGGEHSDFYLQLRETPWKVYYTPETRCSTKRDGNRHYKRLRKRKEYFKKFLEKWDVKRMINTYGLVKEWDYKRDKLKTYRTN